MRIFVMCWLLALLLPSVAHAEAAATCENKTGQLDVQNAITATASGGTVTVPLGNCTWTTRVSITGKALTITGAGIGVTNITDTSGSPLPVGSTALLGISASATNFVSVSGFTFIQGISRPNGMVQFTCNSPFNQVAFRFHHNRIVMNSGTTNRGMVDTGCFGLTDHNTFDVASGVAQLAVSTFGSPTSTDAGFTPWSQPLSLGTINAHYIEDNTFNYPITQTDSACDAYGGARYVSRHNTTYNVECGGHHGTDSGNTRSPVSFEIYDNVFNNNSNPARTYKNIIRGGTGVLYNNRYNGTSPWAAQVVYYRACSPLTTILSWGSQGCNGTQYVRGSTSLSNQGSVSCCDIATNPVPGVGGCSAFPTLNWTANIKACSGDREKWGATDAACVAQGAGPFADGYFDGGGLATGGYPCRDQPGRAPGQVLEPVYGWNNGLGDQNIVISANDTDTTDNCNGLGLTNYLLSGRDYINNGTTPKPGYTAFTYPHSLITADTTAPAPPTGLTVTKLERK